MALVLAVIVITLLEAGLACASSGQADGKWSTAMLFAGFAGGAAAGFVVGVFYCRSNQDDVQKAVQRAKQQAYKRGYASWPWWAQAAGLLLLIAAICIISYLLWWFIFGRS